MERSSNYDFFRNNQNGPQKKSFKDWMKIIWKFTRIVIYFCLAGIGLTGCVQSFVLKTSSTVGSGVELYNSKNDIAPYVNNYQIVDKKVKVFKYENGQIALDKKTGNPIYEEVVQKQIVPLTKENYLVSHATINAINQQLLATYGSSIENRYGEYDNYSSSLRIIDNSSQPIANTETQTKGSTINSELITGTKTNNILFMNNLILNSLTAEGKQYVMQNTLSDINFFVVKRPDQNSLTPEQQNSYGLGNTNIDGAFQTIEVINGHYNPVQVVDGNYVTYDADGDGVNDSSSPIIITNSDRINKFQYLLNAEVATLSQDTTGLFNSEMYARDFAQSLANVVVGFNQLDSFFAKALGLGSSVPTNSQARFEAASKTALEGLTHDYVDVRTNQQVPQSVASQQIDPSKLLTLEQKNAILTYQKEIAGLINSMGYGVKKQVYNDANSEDAANWNTPFTVEFLPNKKDKKSILIGSAPEAQKAIYSWGGAWGLGPFYGLVVWPISYIVNGISGSIPKMNGWGAIISIVLAILITRLITSFFTFKSMFASQKQQDLAPKKAKIDAKYEGFKGNKQMEMRKRQEIADLYKKNNVSLSSPMLSMLITIPIFLAVWRVVQGIPDIKSATWLGIQLSLTSWKELFSGQWQYLPLMIVAVIIQVASQYIPRWLNRKRLGERINVAEKAALKRANKTQNIMMIVFVVMAVIFEAGVQVYWIVSGIWQIIQTLAIHYIIKSEFYRKKLSKWV